MEIEVSHWSKVVAPNGQAATSFQFYGSVPFLCPGDGRLETVFTMVRWLFFSFWLLNSPNVCDSYFSTAARPYTALDSARPVTGPSTRKVVSGKDQMRQPQIGPSEPQKRYWIVFVACEAIVENPANEGKSWSTLSSSIFNKKESKFGSHLFWRSSTVT